MATEAPFILTQAQSDGTLQRKNMSKCLEKFIF